MPSHYRHEDGSVLWLFALAMDHDTLIKRLHGFMNEVGVMANSFGFNAIEPIKQNGKVRFVWVKNYDWKVESIEIIYTAMPPGNGCLLVQLLVDIPYGGRGIFRATNARFYRLGDSLSYKIPAFGFLLKSFFATVINDVKFSIPWFDSMATPEQCVTLLIENNTLLGLPQVGNMAEKALIYLKNLIVT